MCELLGNIKFWTVPPKGFLISSSEQDLSPMWLQGKIPTCGSDSEEKSLECPECFALFQFFFHRNDHICLWILEIFLFIYPGNLFQSGLALKGPVAELCCL